MVGEADGTRCVAEDRILGAQEGQERRAAQSGHPDLWYGRIDPFLLETYRLSLFAHQLFDVMPEAKKGGNSEVDSLLGSHFSFFEGY